MVTKQISDETFRQIRDFIYEKSGIFVPDNKKYLLENRLHRRLAEKNLKSYEDYLYLIKYAGDREEMRKLFDVVTTNETFFFREPQQFEVLTKNIIPGLIGKGARRLRIWSAACSTGEEPYTIAMLLKEHRETSLLPSEIISTDLSASVIEAAKKGIYTNYAVRNMPPQYLKKYFDSSNGVYRLNDTIKAMVRFSQLNLVDEKSMKSMRNFDIVFCRNVLIYFDDRAKKKAVSLIYDAMKPGGYLFIGTSESLHNVTRAFRPAVFNKTVVYERA